jgi:hypothetical protein
MSIVLFNLVLSFCGWLPLWLHHKIEKENPGTSPSQINFLFKNPWFWTLKKMDQNCMRHPAWNPVSSNDWQEQPVALWVIVHSKPLNDTRHSKVPNQHKLRIPLIHVTHQQRVPACCAGGKRPVDFLDYSIHLLQFARHQWASKTNMPSTQLLESKYIANIGN